MSKEQESFGSISSPKDEKQFYDAVRAILGEDGGL